MATIIARNYNSTTIYSHRFRTHTKNGCSMNGCRRILFLFHWATLRRFTQFIAFNRRQIVMHSHHIGSVEGSIGRHTRSHKLHTHAVFVHWLASENKNYNNEEMMHEAKHFTYSIALQMQDKSICSYLHLRRHFMHISFRIITANKFKTHK